MNFPQFWARGRNADFLAWRWSLKSPAEAQALADQAAQQLADRFRAGLPPPKHGGYYRDSRQIAREERAGKALMKARGGLLGFCRVGCWVAIVALVSGSVGVASQPSNDMFADRLVISGPSVTVSGNNTGGTKEPGEPDHAGDPGGASVWWSWRAPAAGTIQVSTAGSTLDTLLAVYTGTSVSALTLVASNDDAPDVSDNTSKLTFSATAGVIYQIAVDGYGGDTGYITLSLQQFTPPPNDMFANRITITGTNATINGTSLGATKEPGEPDHAGDSGGASVWWSWVAPVGGDVQVSTTGSTFDTLLAVYTGTSVTTLTMIASNDDDPAATDFTSKVVFTAAIGQTYQIAVDGYAGDSGAITLRLQPPPPPPAAPAWQLLDPYDVTVRSSDFSGKVVIFNFWATWCEPCRAEMPDLVAMQAQYANDGLVVLGADIGESAQTILGFLASFTPTINYRIVRSNYATEQAFGGPSGISAIPMTYVIDRDNNIRRSFLGTQSGETFESAIIPLLYEKTPLKFSLNGSQPTLSWPVTVRPFTLESTPSLNPPSWTQWPTEATVVNGTNTIQVLPGANHFFRLRMAY